MREFNTTKLVACSFAVLCTAAARAGDTWDGGGANDNWTNGNNWNGPPGFQFPPPNNGTANLTFPAFGGLVQQPIVDVPYSINSMTFNSGDGRYVILGAAELTIGAGGILNNDADMQSVIGPVKLAANQTWNAAAGRLQMDAVNLNGFDLRFTGSQPIDLPSLIVGTGDLWLDNNYFSTVTMSGGSSNTYVGHTSVDQGTLVLLKTGGATAVPGDLSLSVGATVRLAGDEQISQAPGVVVTVGSGGLLDVNTHIETLHRLVLNGGDATVAPLGELTAAEIVVTGATSSWTDTDAMYVGQVGNGTLDILAGGDVIANSFVVGHQPGAAGVVTINGQGSLLTASSVTLIGNAGQGTVNVSNRGNVVCGSTQLGNASGSSGTVNLSNEGSTWHTVGNLTVGGNVNGGGSGHLVSTNGGYIQVDGNTIINANGDISLQTSVLNCAGNLTMNGGALTVNSAGFDCVAGVLRNGANMTVEGGAQCNAAIDLERDATMTVRSGATFSTGFSRVGLLPGPATHMLVDGAGTAVNASFALDVGYGGTGDITITSGASVQSPNGAVGSFGVGSIGSATIDGADAAGNPSSWECGNGPNMAYGAGGSGTINILNGALLRSTSGMDIGDVANASVLVDGAGPTGTPSLLDTYSMWIAASVSADGSVTASNGGRIQSGDVVMAPNGGTATLTVTDPDTAFVQTGATSINLGQASAGSATINIQNNATFTTGTGAISINATGEVNLNSGGVFDARGPINMNGGQFNFLGGTLHADTFNGNLLNQGGTLAPGHSTGTTAVSGNYTQQAGATLQIEIADVFPGDWDQVAVQGNALLNGTLEVVLIDGFQPVIGNMFTIFTTNVGNVGGLFNTLNLPPGMQVTYAPHAVTLEMTETPCLGDVNNSGFVDVDDLIAVILAWGACPTPPTPCPADTNNSGTVDVDDLIAVILAWGACP